MIAPSSSYVVSSFDSAHTTVEWINCSNIHSCTCYMFTWQRPIQFMASPHSSSRQHLISWSLSFHVWYCTSLARGSRVLHQSRQWSTRDVQTQIGSLVIPRSRGSKSRQSPPLWVVDFSPPPGGPGLFRPKNNTGTVLGIDDSNNNIGVTRFILPTIYEFWRRRFRRCGDLREMFRNF
jgi:hypothetical protein